MSAIIQQFFYRSGQLRERVPLKDGQRHGVICSWHKNGKLATEEPFQNGLPHGVSRQWDESGRLLGKYEMVQGTGIQRAWHNNGKLQLEVSTIRGDFCGRNRIWLYDGTLLSERFYVDGKVVSADTYREATTKEKSLPKFRGKPAKLPPKNSATRMHIQNVFVQSLWEKPNQSEALKWLSKKSSDKFVCSLGGFKHERDAVKFMQALYQAGALEVIVPDIYGNKAGDQFADCLLVQLPKCSAKRKAIRKVCAQLRNRRLGAAQPDEDVGESHLYLSFA